MFARTTVQCLPARRKAQDHGLLLLALILSLLILV
jgi:hypothetical protein